VFQSSFSKQTSQGDAEDCYDSLAVPFNKQPSVEKAAAPGSTASSSHPTKQEEPWARQAWGSSGGDVGGQASSRALSTGRGGGQVEALLSQDADEGYGPSRRGSTESGQVLVATSFSFSNRCLLGICLWRESPQSCKLASANQRSL
jgi:hypothetical protein